MSLKSKTILSLICNAVVLTVTTGIVVSRLIFGSEIVEHGYYTFIFFTTDANVLTALASGLVMICDVKILRGERTTVAKLFTLLKYAGVVGLVLTFFTVLFLLIPIYGIAMQWGGTGAHMHVAAPLLSFVSFVFFEQHTRLSIRDALFAILPVVIYGIVYFLQVVVFKNWMDFYAFNSGGMWFVIMPVIIGISFGFSMLVRLLRNRIGNKS